jgi:type I restriction enzyme, R subunit
VIDYLTDRGIMDPKILYESPFTDIDDQGISGVFGKGEVTSLIEIVRAVGRKATAA